MINLSFRLSHPFGKENFKNLYNKTFKLGANKFLQLEFIRYRISLIELELCLDFRGYDHAGPKFEIGLFGYSFYVKLYDKRHWDHINKCWEKYEYIDR